MPQREALSPLTNSLLTPRRPAPSKFVSPSTSRHAGLSSPSSLLSNFEVQDESQQKKQLRRRSQAFELQRKNLGSPHSNSPRATDALNGLTSTQLANHYSDCIKLSAENKINAKNAFGLHLIDYMTELVKKKEMENFQVASSTLDASVKIYAGRVDFIHSHTYKVLSGLGGHQKNINEDLAEGDEPEGMDKPETGTKKKKRTGKTNVIETNLKNINVDKFDLEFEVDPMFQIMSAAFDEGGARGLLLNRLRCFDGTQQLVLDSSTVVNTVEDIDLEMSQNARKPLDLSELKEVLDKVSFDDKQICPSLSEFRFNSWNENTSILPKGFSDFAFDPNAEPEHLPSVEEELEAIAHEEFDDLENGDDNLDSESGVNESDGISGADLGTAEFVESAFSDLTEGSVGKLRQILAAKPSDYSYFNKVLMRTWAGPAHWRAAPVARPTNESTGQKRESKRQKKPPFRLNYDSPSDALDKKYKHSKFTAVTKATWARYVKKRTTLPDDKQLDSQDRLFKLFHKSHLMIKRQTGNSISVDDGIDNYDYDNKNDMENFCPVVREGDDDEDNGDYSEGFDLSNETNFQQPSQDNVSQQSMFSDSGLNGTILTQDKLVAAPHRVQKIDIKYAKAAKRVDVKKLKQTMWTILTKEGKASTIKEPELIPSVMALPSSFNKLKDILPSQVTSSMAKNLTVQTVFACLLYLTNEKTLKLCSTESMDDITIEQDHETAV